MNNFLVPLGGANEVGASCYFLNIDGHKIILDCGKRIYGSELLPDFTFLKNNVIESMNEIELVIMSHAHYDHIGSLPALYNLAPNAQYCCTSITKRLIELQLIKLNRDSDKYVSKKIKDQQRQITEQSISKLAELSFLQRYRYNDIYITLYPAGHMAGAAMTLIETNKQRIVYTGDFSFENNGINEFRYDVSNPDILIICATYAYNKDYNLSYNSFLKRLENIFHKGKNILIVNSNIAKFIDLIYILQFNFTDCPIYLSPDKEVIADEYEKAGFRVYSKNIKGTCHKLPFKHIVVSSNECGFEAYEVICFDTYSLHASYNQLKDFIVKQSPKQTYLVHAESTISLGLPNELHAKFRIEQCSNLLRYYF